MLLKVGRPCRVQIRRGKQYVLQFTPIPVASLLDSTSLQVLRTVFGSPIWRACSSLALVHLKLSHSSLRGCNDTLTAYLATSPVFPNAPVVENTDNLRTLLDIRPLTIAHCFLGEGQTDQELGKTRKEKKIMRRREERGGPYQG